MGKLSLGRRQTQTMNPRSPMSSILSRLQLGHDCIAKDGRTAKDLATKETDQDVSIPILSRRGKFKT